MNADQVIAIFNRLEASLDDLSPVMDGVRKNLEQLVRTTFRLSVDPYGRRWKSLAPATILQRRKKGIQGSSPLFATGELFASIDGRASGQEASVFVGTEDRPAGKHQFGDGNIPARPFLPIDDNNDVDLPESWAVEIMQPIIDRLERDIAA